jgi:hypothetical protein
LFSRPKINYRRLGGDLVDIVVSGVRKPNWKTTWKVSRTLVIVGSLYAIALSAYHLAFPEIDVTMSDVETNILSGELNLLSYKLRNGAFIDLKDPVVACDMKGSSGTTIRTTTKTLYEVLPAGNTVSFGLLRMGETPDQTTQFKCYVKSASVKWEQDQSATLLELPTSARFAPTC